MSRVFISYAHRGLSMAGRLHSDLAPVIAFAVLAALGAGLATGTALAQAPARAKAQAQAPSPQPPSPAPRSPAAPPRLRPSAIAQLQALAAEKRSRTPAQQKLDSNLLYALLRQRRDPRLAGLTSLRLPTPAADGTVLVEIQTASPAGVKPVLARLRALAAAAATGAAAGATATAAAPTAAPSAATPTAAAPRVVSAHAARSSIRARLSLDTALDLAGMPEVRFVRPASRAILEHFDSEGDATHLAAAARGFYGVDGTGVKICVLSDGIDSLADLQAAGELPPTVDVLPGQAGAGDEGTAMLEIVHDLAPGAALGFATGQAGEASFAANILGLRATAHCDILVDDLAYQTESPFQDNQIADAVNQVTAAGALYFSSAGNEGNLDAGTSGTWEGDFKPNGNLDPVLGAGAGSTNDFGDGGQSDAVTADTVEGIVLHWADPAAASCNDYDLYVLDSTLSSVVEASTNVQTCTQDPIETVGNATAGEQVVIVLAHGAGRLLNVLASRGQLQLATDGCTRGHNSAAAAFGVAAAPAAAPIGIPGAPHGPFPNAFSASQLPEPFTCDGPRRIFFDVHGDLLPGAPPGDFSSTGGVVRQKPDLTAADGVSTDVNNFRPFFGTSAAAPHAAAIAGLLESAVPTLSPAGLRAALTGFPVDILAPGWDRDSGAGIVMANQTLQLAGAQPQAVLTIGAVTPTEVSAGGDQAIEPHEDWQLTVTLHNPTGTPATAVRATLAATTPGVGLTSAVSAWPDIGPGASAANTTPFLFTPYALDCGQPIDFTLTVTFAGGPSPAVLRFTLPTGHLGPPVTVSYGGPVVPIPDGGNPPGALNEFPGTPAVVPLSVTGVGGRVEKITLSLDGTACSTAASAPTVGVDHTFVNDLTFDLQSPAGTLVRVISRIDTDGHNFCQLALDDATANPSIESAASSQAPFTGTWQPNLPLGAFQGEDPNGTWNLIAIDHFGQDTGNVRAFSLAITPAVCAPQPPLAALVNVTKAVTGGTLQPGGTVTYTITLDNFGTGATFDDPGDELVDTLPAPLTLLSATASLGTVTASGNTVHWNGGVPAGGHVAITIQAAIAAATPPGTVIGNQAQGAFDETRTGTNQTPVPSGPPGTLGPTEFTVQAGSAAAVPTLSQAGLAVLATALAAGGVLALGRPARRRRRRSGIGTGTALALALACLAAGGGSAAAVEGKWTPEQVSQLDPAWLRSLGLAVPPERLWQPAGGGLLEAAVRIGGCSASFISGEGLLITNHHCAFGILQQHSTPERDLITRGFLAAGRDQELPGANVRATLPHRTTDVSAAIAAAAAAAGPDDLARFRAIERQQKELVAACEHQPGAPAERCEVAAFDGGVRYLLIESLEYPDVRLVYAPPRAVGDFGGEIDNWSWPRHAGDFALLRVYAGPDGKPAPRAAANQPLRPRYFFPLAAEGVRPGDFVMVAGYPGTTFRSLTAPEMRERAELFYPRRAELLGAWVALMEETSKVDAAARIALADRIKSLANVEKNARGQIAGLRRGQVLEKKEAEDRAVLAWAAAGPAGPAVAAYQELSRLVAQRLAGWDRDFLLEQVRLGPKPLDLAMTLVRHAREAAKPDLEREPPFMDRNHDRLVEGLRRDQTRLAPAADAALLADLLQRFAALPEATRVPAVESLLAGLPGPPGPPGPPAGTAGPAGGTAGAGTAAAPRFDRAALAARAASLLAATRVTDLDERLKMLGETAAQLSARRDPLLDLAAGLDAALHDEEERDRRFRGAVSRLRPVWRRAVAAHAGRPLAPDANGTLRVTFAHVEGYRPRDGEWMEPQTRVAGVVEKQSGKEPFDAPAALLAAAPAAPASPWADSWLGDVPVCFLADADTTGGSSGSPVLNGRGELVGVNFDRVWENVANDFGFDPEVARNISVDVRYLLWMLTTLAGEAARPLLQEMLPQAAPAAAASPSSPR